MILTIFMITRAVNFLVNYSTKRNFSVEVQGNGKEERKKENKSHGAWGRQMSIKAKHAAWLSAEWETNKCTFTLQFPTPTFVSLFMYTCTFLQKYCDRKIVNKCGANSPRSLTADRTLFKLFIAVCVPDFCTALIQIHIRSHSLERSASKLLIRCEPNHAAQFKHSSHSSFFSFPYSLSLGVCHF